MGKTRLVHCKPECQLYDDGACALACIAKSLSGFDKVPAMLSQVANEISSLNDSTAKGLKLWYGE